jgi:hypothetical protein
MLVPFMAFFLNFVNLSTAGLTKRAETLAVMACCSRCPCCPCCPCCCRGKSGTEKYINGKWQAVEARDKLRLTQQDGQVWLPAFGKSAHVHVLDEMLVTCTHLALAC